MILTVLVFAPTLWIQAAPPQLDGIYPAGGQAGTEFEVTLIGKFDPWPVQVWCENPGIEFEAGDTKGQLTAKIAEGANEGPTLVRIFNSEGSSEPKIFVIGSFPEQMEGDANNLLSQPQPVDQVPIVVNGKLEKRDDIDFFQLPLEKGQRLTATIDGYGLGSAIDPFLHLYDPTGFEIALASDSHNLDPILNAEAPEDGLYSVQVVAIDHKASSNVSFAGGSAMTYRLTLRTDSSDLSRFPSGATALKPNQSIETLGRFASSLPLDGSAATFRFPGKKGQKINVAIEAHRHGSPLDGVLRIVRPDGKDYKTVDDFNKKPDPEILLTAPLDGDYEVQVRDRFLRGGPQFRYHLVLEEPKPTLLASTTASSISLEVGESTEVPIKITRLNGHQESLSLQIDNLPDGVEFEQPDFPEKSGDLKLELKASAETKAANLPLKIRIESLGQESSKSVPVTYSFQTSESRGTYLIDETEQIWLSLQEHVEPPEKSSANSE